MQVRVRDDFQPLAHLAIAVEGVPVSHDDYPALLVASAVRLTSLVFCFNWLDCWKLRLQ